MRISLNEDWDLHNTALSYTKEELLSAKEETERWYHCNVPCDVRMPLIQNEIIKDPVLADYCYESEWVEKCAWWFVKKFNFQDEPEEYDEISLFIEAIDTCADIFLNNIYIGHHVNVHRPFMRDIREYIHKGENDLTVRVTTGLEKITDQDLSEINWAVCTEKGNGAPDRGDIRRAYVRRAQYTVGWDWAPRVVTCGIVGNVELRCEKQIVYRELFTEVVSIQNPAQLRITANIENLDLFATKECDFYFEICMNDIVCVSASFKRELLTSGYNHICFTVSIPNPRIWWPNGYGEQPLYTINSYAVCGKEKVEFPSYQLGLRTMKLNTAPIGEKERMFEWRINDVPIFCKGGDWIPCDSIYARVTDDKYHTLIKEAVEANFNTLRVWGGGLYEREVFYQLCDKYGILLWHDFMFACATYPDHHDEFREEVRKEMDFQTKRLRNHACLGMWSGNNENHQIFYCNKKTGQNTWNLNYTREKQYGLYLSNVLAKEIVFRNSPLIPFWNGSPYGGDNPNSDLVGDVHYWGQAMMNADMDKRVDPASYDQVTAKFISEYGYIGACCMESIKQYFDGNPIDLNGKIWKLHNNTFEKNTIPYGIKKHYGIDTEGLSLTEYLYFAGAVHGLILGYSLEAIRFKDFCSGAVFWMYNDTWGETGWTIIDYFLRRKMAFYAVKRAFQPQKLIMRVVDRKVNVMLCNDSNEVIDTIAEYGYISFDGKVRDFKTISLKAAPHSRTYIYSENLLPMNYTKGIIVVIPHDVLEPCSLRMMNYQELDMPKTHVRIVERQKNRFSTKMKVTSDMYAHHVSIEGVENVSDNYFDLLPGEIRTVEIFDALDLGQIKVTCMNQD